MQSIPENLARFKSEGDINISLHRAEWQDAVLNTETRDLLEEDARYFLHQSLSTPCMNVLRACEGIYIEDLQGRRYMDFHGNNVHQVGFGNPDVIAAIKAQLDELPFCPRRYTNRPAVNLAKKLVGIAPGNEQGTVLPRWNECNRHGAQSSSGGHWPPQDNFDVGFVPRGLTRCYLGWRRSHLPPRNWPTATRYRARATA